MAGDSDDDMDDASESEEERPAPKKKSATKKDEGGITMQVSSSANGGGGRAPKDTAFGLRSQKQSTRTNKSKGDIVGEKSITFQPEPKKKQARFQDDGDRDDGVHDGDAMDKKTRFFKDKQRRSASGNTFRRI